MNNKKNNSHSEAKPKNRNYVEDMYHHSYLSLRHSERSEESQLLSTDTTQKLFKKPAFSLAEAMITLLMVSIILAAIAPLVSKKIRMTQTGFSSYIKPKPYKAVFDDSSKNGTETNIFGVPDGLSNLVVTMIGGGGAGGNAVGGQVDWKTPGTYTWTVPEGVTEIDVTLVSGGTGGGAGAATSGGKGTKYGNSSTGSGSQQWTTPGTYAWTVPDNAKAPALPTECTSSGVTQWTLVSDGTQKVSPGNAFVSVTACGAGGGGCTDNRKSVGGRGGFINKDVNLTTSSATIYVGQQGTDNSGAKGGQGGSSYSYSGGAGGACGSTTPGGNGTTSGSGGLGGSPGPWNSSYPGGGKGGDGGLYSGGGGGGGYCNDTAAGGGGGASGILNLISAPGGGGGGGNWGGSAGGGGGGGGGGIGGGAGGRGDWSTSQIAENGYDGSNASANNIFSTATNCINGKPGALRITWTNSTNALKCEYNLPETPGNGGSGGGAGGIVPQQKVKVTPGEVLTIVVGKGNAGGSTAISRVANTESSSLKRGATFVLDTNWIYTYKPTGNTGYWGPSGGAINGGCPTSSDGGEISVGNGGAIISFPGYTIGQSKSAGNTASGSGCPYTSTTPGGGDGGYTIIPDAPEGWCKTAKGGNSSSKNGENATGFGGCGGGGGYTGGNGGNGTGGYARIKWGGFNAGGGSSGQIIEQKSISNLKYKEQIPVTVGKGGVSSDDKTLGKGGDSKFGTYASVLGGNRGENSITGAHGKGGLSAGTGSLPGTNGIDNFGGLGGNTKSKFVSTSEGIGGCGGNVITNNCNGFTESTPQGKTGSKPGSGGGGGAMKNNTAYQGGNGADGIVIVEWE